MSQPKTTGKVYLRKARSEGYNLDFLLGLLREGTIKAQGRFNSDYTQDRPTAQNTSGTGILQPIGWIPTESWQEAIYSKQRHTLTNAEHYTSYEMIFVDRKKLDVAFGKLTASLRGAKKQYDDAIFYAELCVYVIGYRSTTIKTHDAFCMSLYSALPYLASLGATAPGLDWLKKKTVTVWKKLEIAQNNKAITVP